MYDYTFRIDERELAELRAEQTYCQCVGWVPEKIGNAITRYERKLGRPLNPDEGQVLVHALTVEAPQNTSRFVKCAVCGEWIDRGKLGSRAQLTNECDGCGGIPF